MKHTSLRSTLLLSSIFSLALLGGCGNNPPANSNADGSVQTARTPEQNSTEANAGFSIPFEKIVLDNGLEVVLHVDDSDPVVAIDLAVHVGSARELPGRTGFAHLFEHLLFLDSENLGYGGLDEMNTRIGGEGTNGFTTNDMTQYFQAVPADALEKIIWAEADKLGYFINTVTQPVVDNEKQVVKNEKRQRVDNQPYGHNFDIIGKALYPSDHPYSWQVIGSLADLDAATLQDVKDFYRRWYVPNNVTVTITGDFEPAEAKRLVEKYFGEIPRGEEITNLPPRKSPITETNSLYYEDNFAKVPRLTMVWPTVEQYHADSAALSVLTEYLSEGKRAPLNEVLIDEEQLTSNVGLFSNTAELAGELYLIIDANAGDDLDGLPSAITKAFERFEQNGISQEDLDRIKAGLEVAIYSQVQSALGKAIQLGEYNLFTGDPGYFAKDVQSLLDVTTDDVMAVYNTYVKNKPYVVTSIVPKGQSELTLEGATLAEIIEEPIVQGAEQQAQFDPTVRDFERTPSSFDRTQEPPFGDPYTLPEPQIWRTTLNDTIAVFGIENTETPLVQFSLSIDAGRKRASVEKPGVANLTADLLEKGTRNKTTAELEDAIKSLGSSISISASADGTFVQGTTLKRNLTKTVAIVEEMLLEPRWDETEFDILKRRQLANIDQAAGNPNAVSRREAAKILYPTDHILHYPAYGTREQLEAVTIDELKAFYEANYTPANAKLRIVGAADKDDVEKAFASLTSKWDRPALPAISLSQGTDVEASKIYFYDIPGAKQSVLRIQRPSLLATDADYPLAGAVNFLLGDIYTSRLNTELRVNKGYTYGIGSGFAGSIDRGTFTIGSSVRSNVTLESLELIKDIVGNYGPTFTEEDLTIMKGALLRGQALANETLGAKLGVLTQISAFGYPDNFQALNAARIDAMSLEDFKRIAGDYLRPDAMSWIVVGDAATQAERLKALGFGDPIMLEPQER